MRRSITAALLLAGGLLAAEPSYASTQAPRDREITLPGQAFYPESITSTPGGDVFISSLGTGEIVRIAAGSNTPKAFVTEDVNVATSGVTVDPVRKVLWACALDLSGQSPSQLRAFDLNTGRLRAGYTIPDSGLCGDITLGGDAVYVADSALGRILRLTTPTAKRIAGGTLAPWSTDAKLTGGTPLKINGIAFDGRSTIYTTNIGTSELFAVDISRSGKAKPAKAITLKTPLTVPDGIRWHAGHLYVAEARGIVRVDLKRKSSAVVVGSLDQPTSLTFVGSTLWITEGQVGRFLAGQTPNLPFKVVTRTLKR
jgi:sugar lactone lactonase YvrE